jgi:hypothetical protein
VLAPLLGGWLATLIGFPGLMITATIVAACGTLLLAFWVVEPRKIRHSARKTV